MAKRLKAGDKVRWNTSQGETEGRVVKRVTARTRIKGHVATASRSNPQYVVKSRKSGAKAAHKASALKKKH
jgi:hypothetical protein